MEPVLGSATLQLGCWEQHHLEQQLDCPICMSLLTDPFVTPCGHTFCYGCISTHLQTGKSCPSCLHYLTKDLIYPNFLLSKIVQKAHAAPRQGVSVFELIQRTILENEAELQPAQIDSLLVLLRERKAAAEQCEEDTAMGLLLHFLQRSREDKAARLEELRSELVRLEKDIQQVEAATQAGASGTLADVVAVAVPSDVGQGGDAMEVPQAMRTSVSAAAQQERGGVGLAECSPQPGQEHRQSQQPSEAVGGPLLSNWRQQQPSTAAACPPVQREPCTNSGPTALRGRAAAPGTRSEEEHAQEPAAEAALPAMTARAAAATPPQPAGIPAAAPAPGPPWRSTGRAEPGAAGDGGAGGSTVPGQHHPARPRQQQQIGGTAPALCSLGGGCAAPLAAGAAAWGKAASHLLSGPSAAETSGETARQKRQRMASQFEDLQECYRQLRGALQPDQAATRLATDSAQAAAAAAVLPSGGSGGTSGAAAPVAAGDARMGGVVDPGLHEFSRILSVLTRCNKLKVIAEIPRNPSRGGSSSSNIISALEFDKEGARFATAGVSKRISIYEFASLVQVPPVCCPPHPTPVMELVTRSKLSCLAWNRQVSNHIASSDYEGVVAVWDIASSALVAEYEAHTKRIWSLDYCTHHPAGPLLASASDDCSVKLWSTASPNSVGQIDMKANVCAVKWRPGSQHELAVGSADHCLYLYDTRATARPLYTLAGHRKAVSYVRFCSPDELLSASTDSTLRLWGFGGRGTQQRVFEGHLNDKNFVGLSVEGDFLACGSETNEVFVYYKALSKPIAQQSFLATAPGAAFSEDELDAREAGRGQGQQFISAVTWRPGSQLLLAANSQGNIKLFQLTSGDADGHVSA